MRLPAFACRNPRTFQIRTGTLFRIICAFPFLMCFTFFICALHMLMCCLVLMLTCFMWSPNLKVCLENVVLETCWTWKEFWIALISERLMISLLEWFQNLIFKCSRKDSDLVIESFWLWPRLGNDTKKFSNDLEILIGGQLGKFLRIAILREIFENIPS